MQHRLKSLLPILLAPIFLACGAIAQEKGHAGKPIHVRGTLTDEVSSAKPCGARTATSTR